MRCVKHVELCLQNSRLIQNFSRNTPASRAQEWMVPLRKNAAQIEREWREAEWMRKRNLWSPRNEEEDPGEVPDTEECKPPRPASAPPGRRAHLSPNAENGTRSARSSHSAERCRPPSHRSPGERIIPASARYSRSVEPCRRSESRRTPVRGKGWDGSTAASFSLLTPTKKATHLASSLYGPFGTPIYNRMSPKSAPGSGKSRGSRACSSARTRSASCRGRRYPNSARSQEQVAAAADAQRLLAQLEYNAIRRAHISLPGGRGTELLQQRINKLELSIASRCVKESHLALAWASEECILDKIKGCASSDSTCIAWPPIYERHVWVVTKERISQVAPGAYFLSQPFALCGFDGLQIEVHNLTNSLGILLRRKPYRVPTFRFMLAVQAESSSELVPSALFCGPYGRTGNTWVAGNKDAFRMDEVEFPLRIVVEVLMTKEQQRNFMLLRADKDPGAST